MGFPGGRVWRGVGAAAAMLAFTGPAEADRGGRLAAGGTGQASERALATYGYGRNAPPNRGPTLDLRGAFIEVAPIAPRAYWRDPPAAAPAPPAPKTPASGPYRIQIGAYADRANAQRARLRAAEANEGGAGAPWVEEAGPAGEPLFRVRLGGWASRAEAEAARAALAPLGFPAAIVTRD